MFRGVSEVLCVASRHSSFSFSVRPDRKQLVQILGFDHIVLTVTDIEASSRFYARVLGMQVVTFAGGRRALAFGQQKVNLHQRGKEFEPKASAPTPGSADLCFIAATPIETVIAHLQECGIAVLEGPVPRTGVTGPITSVYFRDPDSTLIEVANYIDRSRTQVNLSAI